MRQITNAAWYRVRFYLRNDGAPKLAAAFCALMGILGVFCLPAQGQMYVLGQDDAAPEQSKCPGCDGWICKP